MSSLSVGAHSRQQPTRWAPARQGFASWRRKAGLAIARNSQRITGFRRLSLTVGGFVCVDASAFQLGAGHISAGVGLLTTGVSAFVFEYLASGD